ncbi:MAG: hypothetical protein NTV54_02275 [Ignavibacteriales bacterium]|nr:hypothetical protein [Ignavibacteriales bacterium]
MSKQSSDVSTGNRNFPVMTLFATLLFVCAILQFLWMEHSWQQAAASVADAKARLVGEALRQRLQFQEQFLTSFQPYTLADASSMELQMENYCRQHPEVVYAAIANDSERVISKAGSGISHDVEFVVPEISRSSGYSDGPKYNESRTLLGSQIFARSDHGQWSITTMISYKELLKSVIIGDQLGGYEARLLDVKGDILSSTGAAGDGSKPRAEYSIAVGAARMLLEVTDVAGSFWTPWMLLLAALEAILFLAMFFSLWRTGRRFRLVRRSDYAAYQQTAYFKALWDTAEDAMKLTDRNGQTVLVNTAYSILFQISPDRNAGIWWTCRPRSLYSTVRCGHTQGGNLANDSTIERS